jgi:hypothetical protein
VVAPAEAAAVPRTTAPRTHVREPQARLMIERMSMPPLFGRDGADL